LVTCVRDDVPIINLGEEFAHIAIARVVAFQVPPDLSTSAYSMILWDLGGTGVFLGHFENAAVAQLRRQRRWPANACHLRVAGNRSQRLNAEHGGITQEIPEDLHAGAQAEASAYSFAIDFIEPHEHCLVFAGGKAKGRVGSLPATFSVRH